MTSLSALNSLHQTGLFGNYQNKNENNYNYSYIIYPLFSDEIDK